MKNINQRVIPFFTFKGNAKEAMNYYVEIFPDSKILDLTYFTNEELGSTGTVMNGTFEIMGLTMMVMDMAEEYCPDFSWATTMLLNTKSNEEFDDIFNKLAADGKVLMGPQPINELKKVAWITDKFNITWQIIY